ncbi:MAG: orotidine-5'-phosphate decarboxylase [Gammaproteobacteria bacterium]|tara:strand:- start:418 stop:1080 length:663 start_codon:yes stop_codon:yes gene_type:complete
MIIVAIDETDFTRASKIIDNLDPKKCMVKIGSVSFNSSGHELIFYAAEKGFEIFLDLKLHDIPNTVKKSIEGLAVLPIKLLTIHASGGKDMMKAAMEGVSGSDIKVFGVTALTSLSDNDTNEIYRRSATEQVNAMLDLAESACIDGVVCSPHELELVSKRESLLSITPGIRLDESNDDQKRVMTPKQAIELGADYLVIGRPITESNNIKESLSRIVESLK